MDTPSPASIVTPDDEHEWFTPGRAASDETAIAICGIGLRLPGGVRNTTDYWDLLVGGKDARGPIPASRYNIDGFDEALGDKGAIKTRHGYFLDEDLSTLDTSFFSMTRKQAETCDPQQRQLLEVVKECLDDAGEVSYRGQPVGCYVGTFGHDWTDFGSKETQHQVGYGYIFSGNDDVFLANRVSYEYDLKGPSLVIKTGCSASLIALHEACRAMNAGDATAAIVAGTSLIMTPTITAAFTSEGLLSPDGSCKTFDAGANGFARAEGITAVFIKPLRMALRDGNAIRAVIRATGTNSDGRGKGLLNPNSEAQEALMRKVYLEAGLNPGDTAFVECHGTGTPTGDPIETTAVGNVFGEDGVYIGSVKPNVGHSEGSSGVSSLIKAVLALENRTIPPNIKFANPNPLIPFAEKRLKVPTEPTPFPADRAERISINSFGIGGTNAHVIVDSYHRAVPVPLTPPGSAHGSLPDQAPELLLFSANTAESLKSQIDTHREFIRANPHVDYADLAYTLSQRRAKLPHRAFAVLQHGQVTDTSPASKAPAKAPKVYLIFSGQGAQWPTMGSELIRSDPSFRMDLERMDQELRRVDHPPDWNIIEELQKSPDISRMNCAELAQPLCTALQIALVNKLFAAGISPTAVVGHSSGEIAAAYAAGLMSMEAAIVAAYYRGLVTKSQTLDGAMAAIGLGPDEVAPFLSEGVVVACENSPCSVTISGDRDKVLSTVSRMKRDMPDVLASRLRVDMAYHSYHMATLGTEYVQLLKREARRITPENELPHTSFISSVTGDVLNPYSNIGPEYWRTNLISPVRFSTAVSRLLDMEGDGLLVEVGPHSALAGPLRQICSASSQPFSYVPSMVRGRDCLHSMLLAFGGLFREGVTIDTSAFCRGTQTLSGLPPYPWDHRDSFWYESRVTQSWRFRKFPHHVLLGDRIPESPDTDPQWRNVLSLDDESWFADHKVRRDVVFPFAGYIAMAGEAVRQLTGVDTGYGIRHAIAHTALVLVEAKGLEMVTSLRRHKLTDIDGSDWYDFSISSYAGSNWMMHCDGQVRAISQRKPAMTTSELYPRKVSPARFFEYVAEVGINFGPEFQRLDKVRASATKQFATADVRCVPEDQRRPYTLHPAEMDACFQLLIMAQAHGLGRNFTQLKVPTLIESLEVFSSGDELRASAWGADQARPEEIECIADDGHVALRLSGMRMTPVESSLDVDFDVHAAARLEWEPHSDFVDPAPLFKPPVVDAETKHMVEEFTLLSILDSAQRLKGLAPAKPHFAKLRDWLQLKAAIAASNDFPLVSNSTSFVGMSPERRRESLARLYQKLLATKMSSMATGIKRMCDNCESLFTGGAEAIEILMQDGVLTELYNLISFGYGDFVRTFSSTKPALRILEVGAGTGGTTELILRNLVHEGGLPRYSTYTFTDISSGFFPQAKERFSYAANMEYKVFDISKSPLEQHFAPESYDLIIAANVVHATPVLKDTLSNMNLLLKPGGALILTEICTELSSATYIFGNFVGWWLGEHDGRLHQPYVPVERWDLELRNSGYTGADTVVYDSGPPYTWCATIMSHRIDRRAAPARTVTLLADYSECGIAKCLADDLCASGWSVSAVRLGEPLPSDQDIISCLDVESNFFEGIPQGRFKAFQGLLRSVASQPLARRKLLWLTRPAQIRCRNPRSAQAIGVARTVRAELAVPFHTLEIDESEACFNELVTKVFNKIRTDEDDNDLASDREYAVTNGVVCVSRYHPFSLATEMSQRRLLGLETTKQLDIAKLGHLESLYWKEIPLPALEPTHVEIEPKAVGLNLKDVLTALGVLSQAGLADVQLGLEISGTVSAVGSKVDGLSVGDRVFAMSQKGIFASRLVIDANRAMRIPDSLSFEEAASIPIVFSTAIHCLMNIGRLRKGQSVLIHAACGGVGLAAIQVCKMIGAEVYATVGSEEKTQYLVDSFGIHRSKIFCSRDDSFVHGLLRETANRGVDIVLNSLSGHLLHASWKCVAEFGIMVEIGKRDLLGHGKLDMRPFIENRMFACVDGIELLRQRNDQLRWALETFMEGYNSGSLRPVPKPHTFKVSQLDQAFRYLQNGNHIGKVVISDLDDLKHVKAVPVGPPLKFDPKASYLLTGGLGGLGKATATWMVERGARLLTFLSRSRRESRETKEFQKELESMGCTCSIVSGSVDKMEDVKAAIAASAAPIRGVFHFAMVLSDVPFMEMAWDDWDRVGKPKIDGAWNLHKALSGHALDFFWLASSIAAAVDQPGQGNYTASNTFLEAFCQYRRGLGLPTAVLGICPIKGVGFVAERPGAQRSFKTQGLYSLGEREYLDFLELSILSAKTESAPAGEVSWKNAGQITMGLRSELHLKDGNNRTNWRRDRRMGSYHNMPMQGDQGQPSADESSELKVLMNQIGEDASRLAEKGTDEFIAREVGRKVFDIMLTPGEEVDISLSLTQIGLDSLMATELRRWIRQVFGLQISALEIMGSGSLAQLAQKIKDGLGAKLGGGMATDA